MRVLIVDDDPDMRALARLALDAKAGIKVAAEAASGAEGLAKWRETNADVVVLDYRMPDRNGLEVATEMLGENPQQGIVLFSAYVDTRVRTRCDALGICEILEKDRFRDLPEAVLRCAAA